MHRRQRRLWSRLLHPGARWFHPSPALTLRDDFLDARGMNAAVLDQALHGFAGDFAADGVEAGKQHRAGSVIDEDGDAGGGFESADVPAFAADDAAFDFVALEGNGGGGVFEGVFAGVALDGDADDAARFFFGLDLGFFQDVAGEVVGVAQRFLFDALEESALRCLPS